MSDRDDEVERLRAEVDEEQERADRLEQGIREHRHSHPWHLGERGTTDICPAPRDYALWALLDSDGDSEQKG